MELELFCDSYISQSERSDEGLLLTIDSYFELNRFLIG